MSEELLALVRDELNVKEVVFVEDVSDLVTYRLLPDNKVLGPRFGKRFPALRAALLALSAGETPVAEGSALDSSAAVKRLRAGLPLLLELAADEVLVREEPREGLAVASERAVTVAMDTVLTPDLVAEGLAREVIRRVQNLRKEAGFNLDDRIVTTYQAEADLAEAIETWRDHIAAETLSVELRAGPPDKTATIGEDQVGDHPLKLGVRKA
jgi:isoleucyl-tRNA synthetase